MRVMVDGNTLRNPDGIIVASFTKNHRNQWRWHSSILNRFGRAFFSTQARAINAACKSLNLEIF